MSTTVLKLIPCQYRDGMVISLIARPEICSITLEARNAQEIIESADRLHAEWNGTVDATMYVACYSRKVSGFDTKVKNHVRTLYCTKQGESCQ